MFVKHIKNSEGLIYKQGGRIAIELDRFVAVIHPPDTKITLFKLKDKYRDYEDYANQMNMPNIKAMAVKVYSKEALAPDYRTMVLEFENVPFDFQKQRELIYEYGVEDDEITKKAD